MKTRTCLVICLGGAATACTTEPATSVVEQAAGGRCDPMVCGYNSPEVDHYGLHELERYGQPNGDGFSLAGFRRDGVWYQLDVSGGQITGSDGVHTIAGKDLIGAEILVDLRGVREYIVRIGDVGEMQFAIGAPDPIETYVLEYKPSTYGVPSPEGNWVNVCGNVDLPGPPDSWWYESFGQRPVDSIVFAGDRFDLATMTTNKLADPAWFNIGCAGHTLAKLHLTRNTLAADPSALYIERQATLKMLVADYCGDGTPFTVAGQRLTWQGGPMKYYVPPANIEARWNENGAVCLDNPRMVDPTTQEGADRFPDIKTAIEDHCALPQPCANQDPDDFDGALRISGNY